MINGILFDMDGVLVDSEEYICKAGMMMFSEYGIKALPGDFIPFTGMGENKYLGGVAEKHGLKADIELIKARAYEIYGDIVKGKLNALPGAKEFISHCRNRGMKLALATSADAVKMLINLREIGIEAEAFDVIVTGLDVVNRKPFPDIYLKAASGLGLHPEDCLVVEDAVSGVSAGKAAGCRCLALTTSFPAEKLQDADWICSSLSTVPPELMRLLG
jgi:HAD superfamily hydrolase (TIGR01509 family)